ncbi:MAG TPA: acyl-CoA dehydrogenase family protein, partial [Polyangia bacterium]
MDLSLSSEQTLLRDTARDFAAKVIAPQAAEIDREHRYPKDIIGMLGDLGLMGVSIPEEWGGAGMDAVSYALALEEISAACASTGVVMSVNNSLVCDPILKFGSEAQKRDWLVPLAAGKKLGCFALSEPEAGSDAAAQKTVARRDGDGYVINGTKNFITIGPVADVVVLMTMTKPEAGHKGITGFLLDTKTPGLTLGPH